MSVIQFTPHSQTLTGTKVRGLTLFLFLLSFFTSNILCRKGRPVASYSVGFRNRNLTPHNDDSAVCEKKKLQRKPKYPTTGVSALSNRIQKKKKGFPEIWIHDLELLTAAATCPPCATVHPHGHPRVTKGERHAWVRGWPWPVSGGVIPRRRQPLPSRATGGSDVGTCTGWLCKPIRQIINPQREDN